MYAAAQRAERMLQRECSDPQLRVRWDPGLERFVIGRRLANMLSNHIEWFYVVTDGNSGYRPVDMRTVRKIISLDTWRRKVTYQGFLDNLQEHKEERETKRSELIRYRLKHEARYIKRMAEKDGIV